MIQTTVNPIQYSTYIPQQDDIENNIEIRIKNKFITDIEENITKIHSRLNNNDEQMEKLKKKFYETVQIKLIDTIVSIVLFVVIYVKVYT
jgi:hypothetical protein